MMVLELSNIWGSVGVRSSSTILCLAFRVFFLLSSLSSYETLVRAYHA